MIRIKEVTSRREEKAAIKDMRKKGFKLALVYEKDQKTILVFENKNRSSKN